MASRTVSGEEASSRVASEAVKPGGMCWTISVPAPSGEGSWGMSSPSAFGPPVEQAMTTTFLPADRGAADRTGAAGRRAIGRAAGRRARPLWAASPTLRPSSDGEGLQRLAEGGLGDQLEGALGQRVDGAGAVGGGEGGDHDDRHRLGLARAQGAEHAEAVHAGHVQVERHARPGRCSRHAASASSPSAAVATTSKP